MDEALKDDLALRTLAENFYLQALDQLSRANIDQPSLLPGWTRKHVAVHMLNNAEALLNLTTWARTGIETPMYPSREVRDADIENGVGHIPNDDIRAMSHEIAQELEADFAGLTAEQWAKPVRNGQGHVIPASAVPWMRAREAFIHALDLAIGMTALDFPTQVTNRILSDLTSRWEQTDTPAHFTLTFTDRDDQVMTIATGDLSQAPHITPGKPVQVRGHAGEILQYLLGRGWPVSGRDDTTKGGHGDSTPRDLPKPPTWI